MGRNSGPGTLAGVHQAVPPIQKGVVKALVGAFYLLQAPVLGPLTTSEAFLFFFFDPFCALIFLYCATRPATGITPDKGAHYISPDDELSLDSSAVPEDEESSEDLLISRAWPHGFPDATARQNQA